jgi:hypothetical protein
MQYRILVAKPDGKLDWQGKTAYSLAFTTEPINDAADAEEIYNALCQSFPKHKIMMQRVTVTGCEIKTRNP